MVGHAELFNDYAKNLFYVIYHHACVVVSVLINITLIILILKCRRKEFGAYRYLLLIFASVDIYYALVHFLVMPVPESWDNAFYMGSHGYVQGRWAVCWFGSAHSHSFPVLVFHFLYRLLAVKSSKYLRWFYNRGIMFVLMFIVVAAIGLCWLCVLGFLYGKADAFSAAYMAPILEEHALGIPLPVEDYVTAVFWTSGTFSGPRWKPIIGVFLMALTMGGGYTFMVYAAIRIRRLRTAKGVGDGSGGKGGVDRLVSMKSQSEKTMRLQKQLMTALLYQTILPLITAYSPPLLSVVNPFLGISVPEIAEISPILCGAHPWIDGCVIIWTIKEYRMSLFGFLCRKLTTTTDISTAGANTASRRTRSTNFE